MELLTAQEVADMLRVDTSTVYRMAKAGKLKSTRSFSGVRFDGDFIKKILKRDFNATDIDEQIKGILYDNGTETRRNH